MRVRVLDLVTENDPSIEGTPRTIEADLRLESKHLTSAVLKQALEQSHLTLGAKAISVRPFLASRNDPRRVL